MFGMPAQLPAPVAVVFFPFVTVALCNAQYFYLTSPAILGPSILPTRRAGFTVLLGAAALYRLRDDRTAPILDVDPTDAMTSPELAALEREAAGFIPANASELRITRASCKKVAKVNRHLVSALGWAYTHLKGSFFTATSTGGSNEGGRNNSGEKVLQPLMHPLDFHLTTDALKRTLNKSAVRA